jgi:hypothetical protein
MAVTNSFTDTIAVTYTGNGKAVTSKTGTYTGNKDAGIAGVVPAGTEVQFAVAFPVSGIQSLIIASDQNVQVNTNGNAAQSPPTGDRFNPLMATAAVAWGSDYVADNPLTVDVTTVYVKNTGTVDAKFNLRVLYT